MAVSRNQIALVSEPELEDWDNWYPGETRAGTAKWWERKRRQKFVTCFRAH